jgi:luciferase family oxidoreductase group 1
MWSESRSDQLRSGLTIGAPAVAAGTEYGGGVPVVPLSVLDLAPVPAGPDDGLGSAVGVALRNSIDLAQHVEQLGYRRLWVAEHHSMPGIASSTPAVLLAHLAMVTSSIRLGSGGVMLPNHAPLAIAEQFGMLEALHCGRIDLGIGRAPGTDPVTARALRGARLEESDDFVARLGELLGFFQQSFEPTHPYARITAVPGAGHRPALWILGSSDYGAKLAGHLGVPYSFAHHFAMGGTEMAIEAYRRHFRPSAVLDEPYVMIGVGVVCAEDEARARFLAGSSALSFLRLRQGRPGRMPSPEEAAGYNYTFAERDLIEQRISRTVLGSPESVHAQLVALARETGVDELMVTTMTYDHADRVRSFELIARGWLDPVPVVIPTWKREADA